MEDLLRGVPLLACQAVRSRYSASIAEQASSGIRATQLTDIKPTFPIWNCPEPLQAQIPPIVTTCAPHV